MTNDLSLNTLVLSIVIGLVGWGLKETAKALITVLIENLARMKLLEEKMNEVLKTVSDIQELEFKLNGFVLRLEAIEDKVSKSLE
jgi:hypothetical protein